MIIRFVIPVVFIINYNGVNLLSNTTMWWRDVYIFYYYIENNYMFRRLIHVQPEDGHYQAPKLVVVLYVIIKYIYMLSWYL